jgi:hypothetical protein
VERIRTDGVPGWYLRPVAVVALHLPALLLIGVLVVPAAATVGAATTSAAWRIPVLGPVIILCALGGVALTWRYMWRPNWWGKCILLAVGLAALATAGMLAARQWLAAVCPAVVLCALIGVVSWWPRGWAAELPVLQRISVIIPVLGLAAVVALIPSLGDGARAYGVTVIAVLTAGLILFVTMLCAWWWRRARLPWLPTTSSWACRSAGRT